MKIEITLSRKIAIGYTMGLMVLIFIGIISYHSIREFIRATDIVAQSHHVMTGLEATLGDVVTAESEVRGFYITGEERFLAEYQKAIAEVDEDFTLLHALIMDARLRENLKAFEDLSRARLERLAKAVALRKSEGPTAKLPQPGTGKNMMDDIRHLVDQMEKTEDSLIVARNQASQDLARRTIAVIILGSLFGILLAGLSTLILTADVAHRERLEREVLEISEREQRRIGQDLHDGVCQHLTGIALLSRSLQQKLTDRSATEAPEATRITGLINEGIEQTRRVTHGLHPVANEPAGLMVALQELANGVHGAGQLACRFECPAPVRIPDQMAATHLYRIAQEAVQNAIRHAQPTAITIRLEADEQGSTLSIADDGCGLPDRRSTAGRGLEIMNYRAHTLGAKLTIRRNTERGTVVSCVLPDRTSA